MYLLKISNYSSLIAFDFCFKKGRIIKLNEYNTQILNHHVMQIDSLLAIVIVKY